MRVTNIMLTNNFLRNMHSNLTRLEETQDRLASGRNIRRPSDNPARVREALLHRSSLGQIEQYVNNLEEAQTWMDVSDGALSNATEVFQRARELAVYGASGTLPQESQKSIAEEVKQLKEQLIMIANTTCAGRYVFGGTRTDQPPYEGGQWKGNEGSISFEIAQGVSFAANCNGKAIFAGSGNAPEVFKVLDDLVKDLETGNTANISQQRIKEIDQVIDNFLAVRGELGAKMNRAEMAVTRYQENEVRQTELLSKVEDADVAQTITELKNQENAYRVTLAAGARIIMPTLIDFLR